ncbi:MAG: pyruvate dehydrogenase (acetyl-transferring) E1 component subunit alpha [Candidatus Hodarchaeota archaeon]
MKQILEPDGKIVDPNSEPEIPDKTLLKLYDNMILIRTLDAKGMRLQRQGRIGFYVSSTGQEATQIGATAALNVDDWVFPSYREPGVSLYRGMSIQTLINQWFGNKNDIHKGRRLPMLFGDRERDFVNPSAPIGTQIIHAAGAGYAAKYLKEKRVSLVFFGDGATSSNDFHSGLNFAAVFKTPTIFLCQNNQWAISVPVAHQTATERISEKATAYGIPCCNTIDGNDILAVYAAVQEAAEKAREGLGPTLIEALTYRVGPHTTSDDPTRYRSAEEVEKWKRLDPIKRFQIYIKKKGLWTKDYEKSLQARIEAEIDKAVDIAEAAPAPEIETIFTDVYQEMPWHLKEQLEELKEFKKRYS